MFLVLKVSNGWKWLELGDWEQLQATLDNLSDLENPSTIAPPSSNANPRQGQQQPAGEENVEMDELPPRSKDLVTLAVVEPSLDEVSTLETSPAERSTPNISR